MNGNPCLCEAEECAPYRSGSVPGITHFFKGEETEWRMRNCIYGNANGFGVHRGGVDSRVVVHEVASTSAVPLKRVMADRRSPVTPLWHRRSAVFG